MHIDLNVVKLKSIDIRCGDGITEIILYHRRVRIVHGGVTVKSADQTKATVKNAAKKILYY